MTARLIIGDVFDRLAELPDNSVDLDDRNAALTRERCGLFVETETGAP